MENDASSAGVLHGGLFSTTEIRILICYIFSTINEPVPVSMLANMLHFEGIANGFEVSDAVSSLEKSGHIKLCDGACDTYVITPSGRAVAKELNTSLSLTVKERAYTATLRMLTKIKNARDITFEITHENNRAYISCTAVDNEAPFITVKMLLADESQAEFIKDRFLENPSEIFTKIIEMLTK